MIHEILSEKGPLLNHWPGYQVRSNQIQLASAIESALQDRESLVLEAPTGTGKTLAYLLPALLGHQRVILSVGNRTLQDHLWWGEYQKLRATVPQLRSLSILKGCDNYLCLAQLLRAQESADSAVVGHWQILREWQQQTEHGEIQTLPVEAEQIKHLRPKITIAADRCSGSRCGFFEKCYFQKARHKAAQAEVLLINHTLLLSDQRLFEKGMGALLPEADAVIVDEAHQLPELLMRSNMEMMDGYRVQRWIKNVTKLCSEQPSLFKEVPRLLRHLTALWNQIHQQLMEKNTADSTLSVVASSFQPLAGLLKALMNSLQAMHQAQVDMSKLIQQLEAWLQLLSVSDQDSAVIYGQVQQSGLILYSAKLHSPFASINHQQASWVFLSATLMVENSFDYFQQVLSLPATNTYRCQESLDYAERSVLCIPNQLPLPSEDGFYHAWIEQVIELCDRVEGGVLLLFSSHAALQECADLLVGKTERRCFIYQADSNRQALLQQFRQQGNGVLLATGTFWQGIDVQGMALSCVAIDKLPFIPPDDLLALVWRHLASQQHKNWFQDYMVPQAITRLRQGVGRLLRSTEDCGVVLLGDRRVFTKPYGMRFLNSLPAMPLVESLQEVDDYIQRWDIAR